MYETNNLNLEIVDISKFPKVYINLKNPSDVKILISEIFKKEPQLMLLFRDQHQK